MCYRAKFGGSRSIGLAGRIRSQSGGDGPSPGVGGGVVDPVKTFFYPTLIIKQNLVVIRSNDMSVCSGRSKYLSLRIRSLWGWGVVDHQKSPDVLYYKAQYSVALAQTAGSKN